MRLRLAKNRKAANGEWYTRWTVTLPDDAVASLGWKDGDELAAEVVDGALVFRRKSAVTAATPRETGASASKAPAKALTGPMVVAVPPAGRPKGAIMRHKGRWLNTQGHDLGPVVD